MSQQITFVVARADNGVIGKDGQLPWDIPADLQHFKRLTLGTPMIMGRKTFESLGKPLPGRRHIVLTQDPDWHCEGTEPVRTVEQALALVKGEPVSIIGGAQIYELFLDLATAIELTEVHCDADGDTFLPPFDANEWREVSRQDCPAEADRPAFSWLRLERA